MRSTIVGLLAAVAACAGPATPVPLVGTAADVSQLAGTWVGEYSSTETGRSGSIVFILTAGSDTAHGDVLMDPVGWRPVGPGLDRPEGRPPQARQLLSIRFVRVSGGEVSGSLDPYTDPVCGCRLLTTFVGRLRADTLDGSYTTRHGESGELQDGRWRAVRHRG